MFAANLSEDVKQASFAWERGAKLQFTAPAAKGSEGSVQWSENLKQVIMHLLLGAGLI